VGHHLVGGLEDRRGGAVVLLELDHLRVGVVLFKVENVADVRAAPAVNGLVVVAHHAEIAPFARDQADQLVLGAVGVLVFVPRM
jgi:hypothetical protein